MTIDITARLSYQIHGPATLLCSLACLESEGQQLVDESLTTSREVTRSDYSVGSAGNRFTKFDVSDPGELVIEYRVTAAPVVDFVDARKLSSHGGVKSLDEATLPLLFPSRYSPSDLLRDTAADLFGHLQNDPYATAVAIEDWLFQHISYTAGASIEQTWAPDTFLARAGVCRDFAHLGIALCRALSLPARYVTVYAHQLQPQDFHAVFEVFIGGRWFVIDGTRKAPLNGLVKIAVGRDAADVALASLYGSVIGTGVEVQVSSDNTSFHPITREDLQAKGNALSLS